MVVVDILQFPVGTGMSTVFDVYMKGFGCGSHALFSAVLFLGQSGLRAIPLLSAFVVNQGRFEPPELR